nr:MAG TPA: hypothetical protein [Caudoviricetes sp.]
MSHCVRQKVYFLKIDVHKGCSWATGKEPL